MLPFPGSRQPVTRPWPRQRGSSSPAFHAGMSWALEGRGSVGQHGMGMVSPRPGGLIAEAEGGFRAAGIHLATQGL